MDDEQKASAQRLNAHLFNGRTDLGFVGLGKTSATQTHQHFIVYCYGKWHGEVLTQWEGVEVVYREGMSPIKAQSL
jgi:hypothetical protein